MNIRPLTTLTTLVAILFMVASGDQTYAQNQGTSAWGKIIQGITGDRTPRNFQAPQGLQGLQGLADMSGILGGTSDDIGSSPSPLAGLQNLLGSGMQNFGGNSGQNSQTDLLSRMNQKSKEAIDRTTQWAQQKKQQMTSKMFSGALERLKPQTSQTGQGNALLQGASSAFDWLKPKSNLPLNQPPIRAAENYGQQPSIRY